FRSILLLTLAFLTLLFTGCQNASSFEDESLEISSDETKIIFSTDTVVDEGFEDDDLEFSLPDSAKHVIYLYPESETQVNVQLDYQGEIIADYPEYDEEIKGWKVTAHPDNRMINHADGLEYSYLFWEGEG